MDQVEEIVDLCDTYAVPTTSPAVRGLMQAKGRLVPVLHLAAYLEDASCPATPSAIGVLASASGRRLCLEVDEADTLVEAELVSLPPGMALPARAVARHHGSLVPILDLDRLHGDLGERGASG